MKTQCRHLRLNIDLIMLKKPVKYHCDQKYYLLFSKVATFVITHVALRSEAFSTILGAGERTFILVYAHMNLKVLLLAKRFITRREGALERLCSIVEVHVGIESYFAGEGFLTPIEGADEVHVATIQALTHV